MSATGSSARRNQACDECKRRKVRCNNLDPCRNCARDGKTCIYSSPSHTIRILEKRLSHYENLLRSVEMTWRRYVPDISLHEALRTMTPDTSQPASSPVLPDQSVIETEPLNADDLEFDESQGFSDLVDGMVSLTVDPHGYMGTESGSAALKFLNELSASTPRSSSAGSSTGTETDTLAALTRPPELTRLLDDYFAHYHPAYPILHEPTFRAQISGAVAKPRDGSWPLLYHIVLAIGSFVGASGSGREDIQLYQAARSHLTAAILEKGSLPLVQSLTLMGNYLQKRNKPNAGFNTLGVAVNMALAIGLHREFHPSRTTPFVMELRRRTWWTLFVFESGARLTLGRPPVTLTGVTVGLPTNMHDYELAVDIDLLPPPQNVPTVTSCLQAQVSLARIANAAHVKLHSSCSLRPCEVLQFDAEVRNWLASLPPYFGSDHEWASSPKMILLWRAAHLRIIICRPFLFAAIRARAPLDIQASDGRYMPNPVSICVSIAHECALSICDYWAARPLAERNRGLAWYASYWLTTAGVVLATCLIYDSTHLLADQWRTELSRTLATLAELGKACDMASKACEILGGYVEGLLPPSSTGEAPNQMNLEQILETIGAQTQPLELVTVPGFEGFGPDFFADFGAGDM
ncbi:Regulatory protein GAL4 [Lasiodiplodia theobromae]|uniref:Regulatory protein GAL4 n=1 Tax=Lasiodiplodia theobromae TaxID=45133 RepID=A0A5N5DCD2_9PEZI|nr:Regulatory protein GAL4 [Lasiodiplodia theobromae]